MEKDLTTLLAERDLLIHKAELEKLREESLHLMQRVNDKIENAKTEITETAITKTMTVLDKIITWIKWGGAIFVALIAAAGFIGSNSLNKELTAYYTDTVQNWLRFDDPNSGSHKVLDDLRTSAMLDSLTLKYERNKADLSGAGFTLNFSEKQRLMSLILDPTTDRAQFLDALKLMTVSRGLFGGMNDEDTGKKIADIIGDENFSNDKKIDILFTMPRESALLRWTVPILNDTSKHYDESIQMAAFRNVSVHYKDIASRFANKNINNIFSNQYRIELANYLINNDEDSNNIDKLINELKNEKYDKFNDSYKSLILTRVEKSFSTKPENIPIAAQYISTQINDGLRIELSSNIEEKPVYRLSLGNYSSVLLAPDKLLSNTPLVNAIMKNQPLTGSRLLKLSQFFQTRDRGLYITILMMKPATDTELVFDNGLRVKGYEILDSIWLRVEQRAGQLALIASWRGKSGEFHEAILTDINKTEQAQFHIDFNIQQLENYTWHRDFNDPDYL